MRARPGLASEPTCDCNPKHLSCISPKEWMKGQLGVWQFYYEKRDVRDKTLHPATFPIALARRLIDLFTHKGELVLDPFVGSGTSLIAARDAGRNAVGFDLQEKYVDLAGKRLAAEPANGTVQRALRADAREIPNHVAPDSVKLIFTSPPYANLLNRPRANKSRRTHDRRNAQLGKVEQYSQDPRDLGTLDLDRYAQEMESIFRGLLPLLKPKAHCVINVPDMWLDNRRITIHISIVDALRRAGYELRNIIIWDRTNIVNRIGIFGWPSNYITMGVTFEYLLDFWRPPAAGV
ncbi:MAG TPA: DNA methyltransferase [Planctomycetota bacterium]|nr:DNA methyltransferase [Planctomycetota bacterium]